MDNADYKILIVDDDPAILATTETLLAAYLPNTLITCTCSERALEYLRCEPIAVVLSDHYMPTMTGAELLKQAHRINPGIRGVLVTARATKQVILDGMNKGYVWKCLEKPWIPCDLVAVTKDALERYHRSVHPPTPVSAAPEASAANSGVAPPASSGAAPVRRKIVIQKGMVGRKRPSTSPALKRLKEKSITIGKRVSGGGAQVRLRKSSGAAVVGSDPKGTPVRTLRVRSVPVASRKVASSNGLLSVGDLLDNRYRIEGKLQEGGSGVVYRAKDTLLNMPVAIKVLLDELANDRVAMAQLLDEARFAMQLSHRHIIRLHNVYASDGRYYLVMELIHGLSLREILSRESALDTASVARVANVLGDALGYAHRHGVYHRDLKPDNIMVTDDGVLKIIDFGLACLARQARQHEDICGTPFYMSPEEIRGDILDARADVYAMGILLHELLTGRLPIAGEDPPEDFLNFTPTCSPGLPTVMKAVLERAMALDRSSRWPDVVAFTNAFCAACRELAAN